VSHSQRNRRAGSKKKSRTSNSNLWLAVGTAAIAALVVTGIVFGGNTSTNDAPTERDPEVVAAGEDLFQANCAVCHGSDLNGTATGPPFLNTIYAPNHHTDEAFQRAVQIGVPPHHWEFGHMAPIEGLGRDDVAKIVAYVRTEQEAAGIFRDETHP
jgi:mono/diheme cytochrome c family protein